MRPSQEVVLGVVRGGDSRLLRGQEQSNFVPPDACCGGLLRTPAEYGAWTGDGKRTTRRNRDGLELVRQKLRLLIQLLVLREHQLLLRGKSGQDLGVMLLRAGREGETL